RPPEGREPSGERLRSSRYSRQGAHRSSIGRLRAPARAFRRRPLWVGGDPRAGGGRACASLQRRTPTAGGTSRARSGFAIVSQSHYLPPSGPRRTRGDRQAHLSPRPSMLTWALKKILGTSHEREIKKLKPFVEEINKLESTMSKLTDSELK